MGSAIYAQAQAEQQAAGGAEGAAGAEGGTASDSDNDVVDAEIVDEGPEDTREGGAA
jgi:molecular chaperone DnaK